MPSRLHVERFGTPARGWRRRVVLVHGFTQAGAAWSALAASLAGTGYEVVAPDAPGHGSSAGVHATGFAGAAGLVAGAGGRGTYVGYSMGGRLCLRAALDHSGAVRALVLVSAGAGLEDAAEREARRLADVRLAERLEARDVRLEEFLEEWLAQPLFATLPPERAGLDVRRANTPAGLAASLRTCGTGSMDPLWERLGELRAPALVVAGGKDARYVALGERLAAGIAGAELAVVPGAGHSVPAEAPAAFERILRQFLGRL